MRNPELLDNLCGMMCPGALYPINVLKDRYVEIFEDEEGPKKIARILYTESKKEPSKVERLKIHNSIMYKLNPNYDFSDIKEIYDYHGANRMANVILKSVQSHNLITLKKWFDEDLNEKLEEIISDKISDELRTEVVPLISKAVESKIIRSKGNFKKLFLEMISDLVKAIAPEED